jgi:hypothetical protein
MPAQGTQQGPPRVDKNGYMQPSQTGYSSSMPGSIAHLPRLLQLPSRQPLQEPFAAVGPFAATVLPAPTEAAAQQVPPSAPDELRLGSQFSS